MTNKVNIPFNFAIPGPFHLFVWALLGLGTWQNILDNNSWILDNQIKYSACPKDKWIRTLIFLLLCGYVMIIGCMNRKWDVD